MNLVLEIRYWVIPKGIGFCANQLDKNINF